MDEIAAADQFIYGQIAPALVSLVSTRVYNAEKVLAGSSDDYVSFGFQSGRDVRVIGGKRVMCDTLWLIKSVCPLNVGNAHARAKAQIEAFDAVLDGIKGVTIGDVFVQGCERRAPVRYREDGAGGVAFLHWGALYRLLLDQAG